MQLALSPRYTPRSTGSKEPVVQRQGSRKITRESSNKEPVVQRKILASAGSSVLAKPESSAAGNSFKNFVARSATIEGQVSGHRAPTIDEDFGEQRQVSAPDPPTPSAGILASKHRLQVHEVRRVLGAFDEDKLAGRAGFERHEFQATLARIFGANPKDIQDDILDDALDATIRSNRFVLDLFLEWYVQKMFTIVSRLDAASEQYAGSKLVERLAKEHDCTVTTIDKAKAQFDKFDLDHSGAIEYNEYVNMMKDLLGAKDVSDLSEPRLQKFWKEIDKNRNGMIDFPEFVDWYLKYFADAASIGLVESMYNSFDPSTQRRNSLMKEKDAQINSGY